MISRHRMALLSVSLITLALSTSGCATASLSVGGQRVEVRPQMSQEGCENLGPVFGKGGGFWGGAFISDERLMEYAVNDLRNKTATKGGNVVVYATHQMAGATQDHGTTTATLSGVAYRCP